MKIDRFSFEDKSREWKLEPTSFNKLTLLVGASGVGKTQILKAINNLKSIALGNSVNGIIWDVEFSAGDGSKYTWRGEFETKPVNPFFDEEDEEEDAKNKPKIINEEIISDGKPLASRNGKIIFEGKETVKLAREKSLVHLLAEEDSINIIFQELQKITINDYSNSQKQPFHINLFFDSSKLESKYNTLQKIQESDLEIDAKVYLAYRKAPETFQKIKDRFIDIFPQVEDIKVAPLDSKNDYPLPFLKDQPFIHIKEKGVDKWIEQGRISSGMFRSLFHISELYLAPEGTIFLIDEFENSLGINCIDELTNDIIQSKRDLQFILTSHHPYIINNINFKNWKLVTRNAGIVKTHPASEYNLGNSKHSAFMQLVQLEEYQTGSEVR